MTQSLINVELFKAGVEAQLGGRKKLHQFVALFKCKLCYQ